MEAGEQRYLAIRSSAEVRKSFSPSTEKWIICVDGSPQEWTPTDRPTGRDLVYTHAEGLRKNRRGARVALCRAKVIKVSHVPGWRQCQGNRPSPLFFNGPPAATTLFLSLSLSLALCMCFHAVTYLGKWNCGLRPAVKPWLMNEPINRLESSSPLVLLRPKLCEKYRSTSGLLDTN